MVISLCKVNNRTESRFPSRTRLLECLRQEKKKGKPSERCSGGKKKCCLHRQLFPGTAVRDPPDGAPNLETVSFFLENALFYCFRALLCNNPPPRPHTSTPKQHTRRSDSPPESLALNLAGFFHQGCSQSSSHGENTKAVDRRKRKFQLPITKGARTEGGGASSRRLAPIHKCRPISFLASL